MKSLILLSFYILSSSSFACVELENKLKICQGDTVFRGNEYQEGAKVVAINPYNGTVTVKAIISQGLYVEILRNLDVIRGCVQGVCVGDTVFRGNEYQEGAKVIAVNPNKGTVTLKATVSKGLYVEIPKKLDVTRGCVQGVCVGDTVFRGNEYQEGAKVIAVNPNKGTVTVKAIVSKGLYVENPRNLDVTDECVDYNNERNHNLFKSSQTAN